MNDAEVRKITADSVVLQDVYGNRYRYGGLGEVARHYPVPKGDIDPKLRAVARRADPRPSRAASAGRQPAPRDDVPAPQASLPVKERLFANPSNPLAREAGGLDQIAVTGKQARLRAVLGQGLPPARPQALPAAQR